MAQEFLTRFNTVGAVRVSVESFKGIDNNVNRESALYCSSYNDPFVKYAYDEKWNIRVQKFVHEPVFECGYVE
jgi:hypothetical protein